METTMDRSRVLFSPEKQLVSEFIELLSDSEAEEEMPGETAVELEQEWRQEESQRLKVPSPRGSAPHFRGDGGRRSKWSLRGRRSKCLSAYAAVTRPGTPVPPLSLMSGLWVDSMDNFLTLDLHASRSVLLHDAHGVRKLQLSDDKWGRLWCGDYVLQEVGYETTGALQSLPPSCLAWRTTQWQISIWHRVDAPRSRRRGG